MRIPIRSWRRTLAKLSLRWADRQSRRPLRKTRTLGLEQLEDRQVLAVSIDSFELVEDTGTPGDSITTNPELTGVVNGDFVEAEVRIDMDGDGFEDEYFTAYSPGDSFVVDPALYHTPSNDPITIDYWYAEYDDTFTEIDVGSPISFTFTWVEPDPEMSVMGPNGMDLVDGVSTTDFGVTEVGRPIELWFTITNSGEGPLELDTNSLVVPNGFGAGENFDDFVPAGESTDFAVSLDASTAGEYNGTVSFTALNDPQYSSFSFDVTGTVVDVSLDGLEQDGDGNFSGTANGDFNGGSVRIEFDHGCGDVDGSVTVSGPGQSFEYDPRAADPTLNYFGGSLDLSYRYVVLDAGGNAIGTGAWDSFSLDYDPPQTGPITVVNPLGSRMIYEDSEEVLIDLRDIFQADPEEQIAFSLEQNTNAELVDAAVKEWMLRLKPHDDQFGCANIVIKADGQNSGDTARSTLRLHVQSVNDHPFVKQQVPPLTLTEDFQEYTLNIAQYFTDIETDDADLRFDFSLVDRGFAGNPISEAEIQNGQLKLKSSKDMFGWAQYALHATDDDGGSVSTTLWIIVDPANDSPTQTYIGPLSFSGDFYTEEEFPTVLVDLWQYFEDVEDLTYLSYSVGAPSGDAIFKSGPMISNGFLTFELVTPEFEDVIGSATFTVSAADRNGATVQQDVDVFVDFCCLGAPSPSPSPSPTPSGTPSPTPYPEISVDIDIGVPEEFEHGNPSQGQMQGAFLAVNDDYDEGNLAPPTQIELADGVMAWELEPAKDNEPDRGLEHHALGYSYWENFHDYLDWEWYFDGLYDDMLYADLSFTSQSSDPDYPEYGYVDGALKLTLPANVKAWVPADVLYPDVDTLTEFDWGWADRWVEVADGQQFSVEYSTGMTVPLAIEGMSEGSGQIKGEFIFEGAIAHQDIATIHTIGLDHQAPTEMQPVNGGDKDYDGVPDFLDGFNLDSHKGTQDQSPDDVMGASSSFAPVTVHIPQSVIDLGEARVRIVYASSAPLDADIGPTGSRQLGPGALRLWTVNEAAARNANTVDQGGDYLSSSDDRWFWNANFWVGYYGEELWGSDSDDFYFDELSFYDPTGAFSYDGSDSFAIDNLGSIDADGNLTFYVEGVHPGEFSIQVLVAPNQESGYVLREVVELQFGDEVTISASDAYGAETADGSDPASFTISRGEGNTSGALNVYYKLVIDPDSTYAHDPQLLWAGQDFRASYYQGYDGYWFWDNYLYWLDSGDFTYWSCGDPYDPFTSWYFDSLQFYDPAIYGYYDIGDGIYTTFDSLVRDGFTLVGTAVIPHGQSSTEITIDPIDDDRTEWDESITLELITYDEFVAMHKTPPAVGGVGVAADIVNPYLDKHAAPVSNPTYPAPNDAHPGYRSYYTVGEQNSATVTILDNDHMDGRITRNVDTESTGLDQETISNGTVAVSVHDGSLTLVLPLGDVPNYRSNDNLRTLVDVEMRLPWNESQFPSTLSGKLTLAGVEGADVAFTTTPLDQYLAVNPARSIRLVVVGPSSLEDFLPTGHYDYDVKFTATIDGKEYDRTVRGATEIVNLVGDQYGTDEFGKRWWLDGLDRLAPSDNITPQGPASDVNGKYTASRLAAEGATPDQSGVALIRGDNTSAWYVSSALESEILEVDNPDDSAKISFGPTDDSGWGHMPGYRYSSAGLAEQERTVSWQFAGLDVGGQYQLFVNYAPGPDRASNAPYTITGAQAVGSGASTKTVFVDQRYLARDSYGSWEYDWRSLGFYVATGDTITVTLSTQLAADSFADGVIVADRAKIVKAWTYATPDGSINKLLYGPLEYEDPENPGEFLPVYTGGFWLAPNYSAQSGHFTLLTKHGTHLDFDAQGLLQATQDRNANRTQLAYTDADGDSRVDELESITTQGGLTTTFVYNGEYLDYVSDYTQSSSRFTNFGITAGQVTDVYQPDGGIGDRPHSRFVYDADAYLTDVRDGEQHHTVVTVTADGQVGGVTNADNGSWTIQSVLANGIGFTRKPGDGEIGVLYDPYEDGPLYQSRAHYKDPRGNDWRYQTDDFGQTLAYVAPPTSSSNQQDVWRWERNKHGQVTRHTEPAGGGGYEKNLPKLDTAYSYTSWYDLQSIEYADHTTERWSYSPDFHIVTSHTDQISQITSYQRDARGNLERLVEPSGPYNSSRTTHYTYTPAPASITELPGGLVRLMTQAEGTADTVTTRTDYYQSGLHIGLISQETFAWNTPVETWVQYEYAPGQRNPLIRRDELGRETQTYYDNLDRLVQIIQPIGDAGAPSTVYSYDAVGNRITVNVNGAETDYQYDEMNRLRWILPPAAGGHAETLAPAKTEFQYDTNGNLRFEILHVDGNDTFSQTSDRFTDSQYDARNLVQVVKQNAAFPTAAPANAPGGQSTQPVVEYRYDVLGNVRFETDPRDLEDSSGAKIKTKYYCDEFGRVTKIIRPPSSENWDADGGHASPETINQYDDLGRLVQVRTSIGIGDTLGQAVTTFVYDALDRVAREYAPADANGDYLETIYEYDLRDNLLAETRTSPGVWPRGRRNYYDALDRLVGVDHADPTPWRPGTVAFYAYSAVGDLQRELIRAGALNPEQDLKIGDGAAAALDALASTRLNDQQNPDQVVRLTKYTTNALGQVTSVTSPDVDGEGPDGPLPPTVTTYVHDINGNVTSTTVSFQEYDSQGQIASGSLTTSSEYDALNRPWKVIQPNDDSRDHVETETVYNRDGSVAKSFFKEFDHDGGDESRDTVYGYDLSGRLVHTASPEPAAGESRLHTWQFYDPAGNLVRDVAANGQITNYAYDLLDRRTKADPEAPGLPTQEFFYYADDTLRQEMVGAQVVDYTYDAAGRMLSETKHDNGQAVTTYCDYNVFGDIRHIEDPAENITDYQYDAYGRVIWEAISPGGLWQKRYYNRDEFGNIIQTIDRLGRTIQYNYNQIGQTIKETWFDTDTGDAIPAWIDSNSDPNGEFPVVYEATFGYTSLGELSSASDQVDGGGAEAYTSYSLRHDNLRRLTQADVTLPDALEYTVKYGHYLTGQRSSLEVKWDNDTKYQAFYGYDDVGRPLSVADFVGKMVLFEYDGAYLKYVRRNLSGSTGVDLVSRFMYDGSGRLSELGYFSGETEMEYGQYLFRKYVTYNTKGLVATTQQSYFMQYLASGDFYVTNRTFTYDGLNQLDTITTQVTPPGGGTVTSTQDFDFDGEGNEIDADIAPYNRLTGNDFSHLAYDDEGNVTERWEYYTAVSLDIAAADESANLLAGTMRYGDVAGELQSGTYVIALDNVELSPASDGGTGLEVTVLSSTEIGGPRERGSVTVTPNADGTLPDKLVLGVELTGEPHAGDVIEFHFDYIDSTETPSLMAGVIGIQRLGSIQKYEWDHHNRLVKATIYNIDDDGAVGSETLSDPRTGENISANKHRTVEHAYDVLGQRFETSVTHDAAENPITTRKVQIRDRNNILLELGDKSAGVLDVLRRHLYAPDSRQLLATKTEDEDPALRKTYWAVNDEQGSLSAAIEVSGDYVKMLQYDVFGQPQGYDVTTGGFVDPNVFPFGALPIAFAGRQFDQETGLFFDGVRYSSAVSKRYLSEAPGGPVAGDTNLYRDSGNSPPNSGMFHNVPFQRPSREYVVLAESLDSSFVFGALQVIGGTGQFVSGVLLAAGTWETGIGAVGGGLLAARGLDDIVAGFRTIYSGKVHNTLTYEAASAATFSVTGSEGTSATVALITDLVTGLPSPGGFGTLDDIARAGTRVGRLFKRARAVSAGQRAARVLSRSSDEVAEAVARATGTIGCFVSDTEILVLEADELWVTDWAFAPGETPVISPGAAEEAWNVRVLLAAAGAFAVAGVGAYATRRRKQRREEFTHEQGIDAFFASQQLEELCRELYGDNCRDDRVDQLAFAQIRQR